MNRVAQWRATRGLSYRQAAHALHISAGHLHDIISGRIKLSVVVARKLEAATGTPWHEWIDGAPE